jgi:IS30 family transposase
VSSTPTSPPLSDSFSDPTDIASAYLGHRYTQQEIAEHLSVHYSTISRRLRENEAGLQRRVWAFTW